MKNGRWEGLGGKLSRVEAERNPNERKGAVNQASAMVKMALVSCVGEDGMNWLGLTFDLEVETRHAGE